MDGGDGGFSDGGHSAAGGHAGDSGHAASGHTGGDGATWAYYFVGGDGSPSGTGQNNAGSKFSERLKQFNEKEKWSGKKGIAVAAAVVAVGAIAYGVSKHQQPQHERQDSPSR